MGADMQERIETRFKNWMGGKLDVFDYGTINGLREPDSLIFVAINNDKPHNGDCVKFFKHIESQSRLYNRDCAIVCFLNDRFKNWVLARPGWYEDDVDCLEYGIIPGVRYYGDREPPKRPLNVMRD